MSDKTEQVLVFPEPRLEPYLGHFEKGGGVVTDPAVIEDILDDVLPPPTSRFMDRAAAEVDPRFKQVIPYCVLWSQDEDSKYVFAYKRSSKGGETRLHQKWSVGVGGHINPIDAGPAAHTPGAVPALYEAALRRELREEVSLEIGPDLGQVAPAVALIYYPSDAVGKVHFGVVHLIEVPPRLIRVGDPALENGDWTGLYTRESLYHGCPRGEFENWSKLVFDAVPLVGRR